MTGLNVYFDARCGLCIRVVRWLAMQNQLVPLRCIPKQEGVDDLVVTADSGAYWRGDGAWLIVLWALADYREWAYRLSRPALLPLARQCFATLSENRALVSGWFGLPSDDALAARLRDVTVPGCHP
jgi:predicted DCC family thiol-disulfide oxidoreductase YuxK